MGERTSFIRSPPTYVRHSYRHPLEISLGRKVQRRRRRGIHPFFPSHPLSFFLSLTNPPNPAQDLQLPPALCLGLGTPIFDVLTVAYDREFDQIPVLSEPQPSQPRRLLGYVDVKALKDQFALGKVLEVLKPIPFPPFLLGLSSSCD